MAADKPLYDLVLLLDADAPRERRTQVLSEVEKMISGGGSIEGKHDWGVRSLAYEIQHRTEAEYHLIQFTAPAELLERLRTTLRVTDGVLRHRVIRLAPGAPPPPAMRPERSTPAEEPAAEPPPAEAETADTAQSA
jgi:small subunit ribosomal protein S6